MNRPNLWQQFKPEFKERLLKSGEKYDTVNTHLIPLLERTNWWTDLRVSDVNSILTFCDVSSSHMGAFDFKYGDKFLNDDKL